ncbi:DUF1398 domain-containing protein [Ferruginibacter lapsinanis]|uniref:DUF1398 domain-containing protein n=1 Tax=Ferruginibacter lapsinanis TaxID=563172 RepID=UPI001E40FC71|nr:DUF1398 family protein [Ferruginibacter lapsinanis]UEG51116.1 DUF1398 domain-containing protein [Ferruginibacter lapsinanis]
MFELASIKEAHSKVKSGADFPLYIQEIKKLGVKKYHTYVRDGHTVFLGDNDYQVKTKRKYAALKIANISDKERFKHYLKSHQRGQTDYAAFCNHSAQTGVEKWTVDMDLMTCTYYDKLNNKMLEEQIPTPG